jgi:hypothetical protein
LHPAEAAQEELDPTQFQPPVFAPAFASPDTSSARGGVLGVRHHSPDEETRNVRARSVSGIVQTSREHNKDRQSCGVVSPFVATRGEALVYLATLHEVEDPWAWRPRALDRVLVRIELKADACFKDLDEFLRTLLQKDDHMSKFTVYKDGQDELGRTLQDTVNGGIFGSDQFAVGFGDDSRNPMVSSNQDLKSTTSLSSLLRAGRNALWTHDLGSPMMIFVKVLQLNTVSAASVGPLDNDPIREVRDAGTVDDQVPVVPPGVVTFDQAFPRLTSVATDNDNPGCFEVGKGRSPWWGVAWNGSGNVGELQAPGGNLDASLRALEDGLAQAGLVDVHRDEGGALVQGHGASGFVTGLVFSFNRAFPKIAKFISTNSRKRWIEVGSGRPGSYIRAKKGAKATIVWESPFRNDYGGSVHTALMDLERHLP